MVVWYIYIYIKKYGVSCAHMSINIVFTLTYFNKPAFDGEVKTLD